MLFFALSNGDKIVAKPEGKLRFSAHSDCVDDLHMICALHVDDYLADCVVIPDSVYKTRRRCYFEIELNDSSIGTDTDSESYTDETGTATDLAPSEISPQNSLAENEALEIASLTRDEDESTDLESDSESVYASSEPCPYREFPEIP